MVYNLSLALVVWLATVLTYVGCSLLAQDLARSIHAICTAHAPAAVRTAIDSAMSATTQHIKRHVSQAMSALLPAELPAAAVTTAAAIVADATLAVCAQGLMQQVTGKSYASVLLFFLGRVCWCCPCTVAGHTQGLSQQHIRAID